MALYTDSSGSPGTLVAYTAAASAPSTGYQEIAVTGAPVSLAAGDYWISWWCSGASCRTSYSTAAGEVGTNLAYYKAYAGTFPSWPASWPSGSSSAAQIYATYGLVR